MVFTVLKVIAYCICIVIGVALAAYIIGLAFDYVKSVTFRNNEKGRFYNAAAVDLYLLSELLKDDDSKQDTKKQKPINIKVIKGGKEDGAGG